MGILDEMVDFFLLGKAVGEGKAGLQQRFSLARLALKEQ